MSGCTRHLVQMPGLPGFFQRDTAGSKCLQYRTVSIYFAISFIIFQSFLSCFLLAFHGEELFFEQMKRNSHPFSMLFFRRCSQLLTQWNGGVTLQCQYLTGREEEDEGTTVPGIPGYWLLCNLWSQFVGKLNYRKTYLQWIELLKCFHFFINYKPGRMILFLGHHSPPKESSFTGAMGGHE